MKLSVICFTLQGYEQMNRLRRSLADEIEVKGCCKCSALKGECPDYITESTQEWAGRQISEKNALLFIGAAGIAVRSVAEYIRDKLSDMPVLVMDDAGRYIIPLLSGHYGGANELAEMIAKKTGAVPVITTSTDVNKKFAIDVFAGKNDLRIMNKDGIAAVSARILCGEKITIVCTDELEIDEEARRRFVSKTPEIEAVYIDDGKTSIPGWCDVLIGNSRNSQTKHQKNSVEDDTDDLLGDGSIQARLYLGTRDLSAGIGCRRGKTEEEIKSFVEKCFAEAGLDVERLSCVASIDIKKNEEGLIGFAASIGAGPYTFTAEELEAVSGEFADSEFVKKHAGVGNVAERASLAACEGSGELILKKIAGNGITLAVARRKVKLKLD